MSLLRKFRKEWLLEEWAKGQPNLDKNIIVITDMRKERELLLFLNVAVHSAVRSIDHFCEVVNRILPGADMVKVHRTKCGFLIKNVLMPCMLKEVVLEIGNQPFPIILLTFV